MGPIRTTVIYLFNNEPPNPNPQTPKPTSPNPQTQKQQLKLRQGTYCSRECQVSDWKAGHKQVCKAFEGARWWCVIVLNIFEHTCKIC